MSRRGTARAARPASARRPSRRPAGASARRAGLLALAATAVVALGAVVILAVRGGGRAGPSSAEPQPGDPAIGGDLHSLVVDAASGRLFVGGHQAVAASADGGRTWVPIDSLAGADAMGWGFGTATVWVSGHPGLNRSDDGGRTFRRVNHGLPSTDVHAFGAAGSRLYGASPAVGVFASDDGGATWEVRTTQAGESFFGRILVDPADAGHLVAADARAGAAESTDGGRTWHRLGGVAGATWVSWAGGDPARLVASGPAGAARSADGGRSWERLKVPAGTTVVETSPKDPNLLYAAGLEGGRAVVWASHDGAGEWARP